MLLPVNLHFLPFACKFAPNICGAQGKVQGSPSSPLSIATPDATTSGVGVGSPVHTPNPFHTSLDPTWL
jgi:hypothetical protein